MFAQPFVLQFGLCFACLTFTYFLSFRLRNNSLVAIVSVSVSRDNQNSEKDHLKQVLQLHMKPRSSKVVQDLVVIAVEISPRHAVEGLERQPMDACNVV